MFKEKIEINHLTNLVSFRTASILAVSILLTFTTALSFAEAQSHGEKNTASKILSKKHKSFNIFSKPKSITPVITEEEYYEAETKPAKNTETTKKKIGSFSADSSKESKAPENTNLKSKFAPIGSPQASKVLPPDERPQMRIDPSAPGSVSGGMEALASGDKLTAKAYAKQYVQYMTDLMFYVREWTGLVTDALYEEGKLDEDEYYRAPDLLDHALAISSEENDSLFKQTHKDALRRITADPKGEVEVIYFFSLDSSYCRTMSPHFERLYRSLKNDKRVDIKAATLSKTPVSWLESYRNYTGLSMPIYEAENLAKQLKISLVPAVVVITKNNNQVYIKSGQQDFVKLYEFVKKSQGQSLAMDLNSRRLINKKIGRIEEIGKGLAVEEDAFKGPKSNQNAAGVQEVSFREDDSSKKKPLKKKNRIGKF